MTLKEHSYSDFLPNIVNIVSNMYMSPSQRFTWLLLFLLYNYCGEFLISDEFSVSPGIGCRHTIDRNVLTTITRDKAYLLCQCAIRPFLGIAPFISSTGQSSNGCSLETSHHGIDQGKSKTARWY